MINSYKDLTIWKQGIEIAKSIYLVTDKFPKQEIYGLTSQIRRAAISIPANIAEGFCRLHRREYVQFLGISLGSNAELITLIIIANELHYLDNDQFEQLIDKLEIESKQIRSLITKIQNSPDAS
ncbi:MAG: four helix bundle protein [bacterium]|nr:four helix bundle protein [bacterium]